MSDPAPKAVWWLYRAELNTIGLTAASCRTRCESVAGVSLCWNGSVAIPFREQLMKFRTKRITIGGSTGTIEEVGLARDQVAGVDGPCQKLRPQQMAADRHAATRSHRWQSRQPTRWRTRQASGHCDGAIRRLTLALSPGCWSPCICGPNVSWVDACRTTSEWLPNVAGHSWFLPMGKPGFPNDGSWRKAVLRRNGKVARDAPEIDGLLEDSGAGALIRMIASQLCAQQDAHATVQGQTDRRNIASRGPPVLRGIP